MDLTSSPHHTTKSPDSDTDTETPLQTHLTRPYLLQKARFGGLALDGCGEFMPKPATTTQDPASLKCAACGCHRNFHRSEPFGPTTTTRVPPPPPALNWTTSPGPGSTSSGPSPSPASPIPQSFYPSAPHMLLALSAGHPDDTQPQKQSHSLVMINPHGKKRARTKFSQEQKEKMYLFAEKLGWRMPRGNNDRDVGQFCIEIGVNRNVFKVWMHNNRSRKEKVSDSYGINSSSKCGFNVNEEAAGRLIGTDNKGYSFDNDNNGSSHDSFDRYQIESKVHVDGSMTPHGSSTSS
ncbi:zinc-finger homeodomain protein 11-like [Populus alba x Populus x berolinensis]|nr:zinc-finger homeodomain protein 11-like [Populus alba x Populus x berolinensis]